MKKSGISIIKDIPRPIESSGQKKAERLLRREKDFNKLIINSSVDGILAFDKECRYTAWNKGMERISGKKRDEVLDRIAFDVFPFLRKTGEDKYFFSALKGKNVVSRERPFTVPETGRQGVFEGYYSPLRDDAGAVIGGIGIIRDITERKLAEKTLAESEERYRNLVIASPDAVLVHSGGKIKFVNPAGMKLFGAGSKDEFLGKPVLSIVSKEFHKIVKQRIRNAQKEQTPHVEIKFVRLDGSKFDGDVTGKRIIYQGSPAIQAVIRDISERKRAEESLNKLNRALKALSDSNHALMRATDEAGYLREVCRIIVKDCGYTLVWIGFAEKGGDKRVLPVAQAGFEKGYLGKLNITWADTERGRGPTGTAIRAGKLVVCKDILTEPSFRPWRKEAIKRGYRSSLVLPLIANNRTFGALNIYSRRPDAFAQNEIKLLTELADDLAYGITAIRLRSAHKEAVGQLRESEIKFRLAFENAQDAILWADTKTGAIIDCNRAAEELFEKPKSEIIGKHQTALHPPEARKCCRRDFRRHSLGGSSGTETPIITRTGKIKTVTIASSVVKIRGRKIIQGIFRDITESKREEEALRLEHDKLQAVIKGLNVGIGIADTSGNTLSMNTAGLRIHGFASEAEMFSRLDRYTKEFELRYPDGRLMPVEEWPASRAMRGEYVRNYDTILVRRHTQEERFLSYSVVPIRDSQGRPVLYVYNIVDLTERKQAREELQRQQAEGQIILDSVPALIFYKDKKNNLVRVNKGLADAMGLNKEGMEGKSCFEIWPRKQAEDFWRDDKKVMQSGRPKIGIIEPMMSPKGERWVQTDKIPYRNQNGEIVGIIGFAVDITERKHAEEALQRAHDELEIKVAQRTAQLAQANKFIVYRSEITRLMGTKSSRKEFLESTIKLLKAWSGCSCLGIRVLDAEGRIPYDAYTGFSREFWESENWLSIKEDQCACIRVIKGRPEPQDFPVMTKGGSFYTNNSFKFMDNLSERGRARFRGVCVRSGFKSIAVIPIRNRNEIYGAIHFADPTEGVLPLKKVEFLESLTGLIGEGIHKFNLEDKIRRDHTLLDAFFKHAITPFVFLDPEFNFIRVNEAYARSCKRDISEFPGHNHFEFYPHEENERIFREVVRTKSPFQAFARPFIFPEHPEWGLTYWDWTLVPILDAKGEVEFLVFSLNDVTQRKLAEERLSTVQKELESAKRLSDIGLLAATVAHELRNPLGVIRTAAYNIKRKAQNPALESHLINIEKKILESDQIINNLLFYARLKAPHYESTRIYDILNECIKSVSMRFSGHNVRVIRKISPIRKDFIDADPLQMTELINNILSNAYDACSGENCAIEIRAAKDGKGNLEIAFKDNGIGMDEEHLKRAFEPFFSTKAKGTGLGLSVCSQIVNLHGGKICIDSEKGRGTTVTVTVPAKRGADAKENLNH